MILKVFITFNVFYNVVNVRNPMKIEKKWGEVNMTVSLDHSPLATNPKFSVLQDAHFEITGIY